MKSPNSRGMTLAETVTVLILVGLLVLFIGPVFFSRSVVPGAQQTKQINNVKQITLACQLFATDNAGVFPNGNYDPALAKITARNPTDTAEACFNDLIESHKLEVEKVFWNPQNFIRCSPKQPDENGTLDPGENCWDYIAGLNKSSPANLPLAFEASDGGTGIRWTKNGGHPWNDNVIVGYVDGGAEKMRRDKNNQIKVERGGIIVDFCLPTPGSHGWPEVAKLAPATPAG